MEEENGNQQQDPSQYLNDILNEGEKAVDEGTIVFSSFNCNIY